jgi:predicted enzyme related to lactoylglutathione lyase
MQDRQMAHRPITVQSQITFQYYDDLAIAAQFYGEVLGFELVEDQRWAKIYRVSGDGFVGIVDGEKGFRRPQPTNAVLLTLVADDVDAWYDHLAKAGVRLLTDIRNKEDIQIRCFFFEDPGGYALEVQQFLRSDLVEVFHRGGDVPRWKKSAGETASE